MKKYSLLILIILVLVGFFSPTYRTQAAGEKCYTLFGGLRNIDNQKDCEADKATPSVWTSTPPRPASTPGTPQTPDEKCRAEGKIFERGTCVGFNSDGKIETTAATDPTPDSGGCGLLDPVCLVSKLAGTVLLGLASLINHLAGSALNAVTYYTVVHMADNYASIPSIETTWGAVRDLANMAFIFILLVASIQFILGIGSDVRRLIVMLIVAAVLMNFSLFLTKVVIDASNVISVTFYSAIAPQATGADGQLNAASYGLSTAYTNMLNLGTIWNGDLNEKTILTLGIMGSGVLLVSAFAFFAVAIMFIIRYLVLIFVLILSPIAVMSLILPSIKKGIFSQWKGALIGQAFFAPIFLFLSWVSIKLLSGIPIIAHPGDWSKTFSGTLVNGQYVYDGGAIDLIISFCMVIGAIIGSLLMAKKYADMAPKGVTGVTKWATGAAGNAVFGGVIGGTLRNTIGKAGKDMSGNADLIERANAGSSRARLQLWASKKAASGSFDARRMSAPTAVIGEAIQGTVGRTKIGKKLGLDEVNIPNIPVGEMAAKQTGVGTGDGKGYAELRTEKNKRLDERRKAEQEELRKAVNKKAVANGTKVGATATDIGDMEIALSKMSDNEVVAIVEGNKALLKNQEFANRISVQQLEAINKTDKLSEIDKQTIKDTRFSAVNDGLEALRTPVAARTPAQNAQVTALGGAIKGLKDKELEMIDPQHIMNPEFIEQLRPAQAEAIGKSNKFTTSQREFVRKQKIVPLINALTPATLNIPDAERRLRKMSDKDRAALTGTGLAGPASATNPSILLDPQILHIYTPRMLKRMGQEMNSSDITLLRDAIIGAATAPGAVVPRQLADTAAWLDDADKGGVDFA